MTPIAIFAGVCIMAATGTPSLILPREPISFVLDKTAQHDVVLLGTTHQRPEILNFISNLIPHLSESGVTHIGLEIASDQQLRLDRFMQTGMGLSSIRIFPGISMAAAMTNELIAPLTMEADVPWWIGSRSSTPVVNVKDPRSEIRSRPIRTRLTCPMSLSRRPIS